MELRDRLVAEVQKAVAGAEGLVDHVLVAILVGGHVLLEGVPGTAKTLLVRTLAKSLGVSFRRVQFTPDMMPSDLTGTMILRDGELTFRPGPVFANLLLADEINRTPPKTQSALLEAMEERSVTVEGVTNPLTPPFLVAATQNPVEYEGTYPLPEAQLDRFLFKLDVGYPTEEAERRMLWLHHQGFDPTDLDRAGIEVVAGPAEIAAAAAAVDRVQVTPDVAEYILQICRHTRGAAAVSLGASPRAAAMLLHAAKAAALLADRDYASPDDVAGLARPLLRHRIMLRPEAELEGYRPDDVIGATLAAVPVPR